MIVGLCEIELFIPESQSLKDKRMILNHLKDKIKNKFNVSIAEVESQDLWQRSILGLAAVTTSTRHADSTLDTVIQFIDKDDRVEVINIHREIL